MTTKGADLNADTAVVSVRVGPPHQSLLVVVINSSSTVLLLHLPLTEGRKKYRDTAMLRRTQFLTLQNTCVNAVVVSLRVNISTT